ncbi:hypothetical protein FO507_04465 [Bacillus mojavensis]|nr:hypothetical protein [Bacillus mojavensis]
MRRVHLVKLRRFSANPVLCGKLFQGYLSSSALFIFSPLNIYSAVQEDRFFFHFFSILLQSFVLAKLAFIFC